VIRREGSVHLANPTHPPINSGASVVEDGGGCARASLIAFRNSLALFDVIIAAHSAAPTCMSMKCIHFFEPIATGRGTSSRMTASSCQPSFLVRTEDFIRREMHAPLSLSPLGDRANKRHSGGSPPWARALLEGIEHGRTYPFGA
jgi:hypothetical protein